MKVLIRKTRHQTARGSAVMVIIILLAIMLVYVLANLKALHYLSRELKLIERRQVERLNGIQRKAEVSGTNRSVLMPAPNGVDRAFVRAVP